MNKKHGLNMTRLHRIWKEMRNRCSNNTKRNRYYAGKGITICKEWDDFLGFHTWAMGEGYNDTLSIDRVDSNGNYEPSNCRWATRKEQADNKGLYKSNKSGFRGVFFAKRDKRWVAQVRSNGSVSSVGYFSNPLQAAFRRDKFIIDNGLSNKLTFNWKEV